MSAYLAIALGGSIGAVSRYWLSNVTHNWLGYGFPHGTLAVNVIGSLIMGFCSVLLVEKLAISEEIRLGIMIGFLGSFTTFSTFAMDSLNSMQNGDWAKLFLYIGLSIFCCLLGAWGGLQTAKQLL